MPEDASDDEPLTAHDAASFERFYFLGEAAVRLVGAADYRFSSIAIVRADRPALSRVPQRDSRQQARGAGARPLRCSHGVTTGEVLRSSSLRFAPAPVGTVLRGDAADRAS